MGRQTLRATPAMIRRAAAMYAPLTTHPPIIARKPDADDQQLDLLTKQPVERAGVHVHQDVDTPKSRRPDRFR